MSNWPEGCQTFEQVVTASSCCFLHSECLFSSFFRRKHTPPPRYLLSFCGRQQVKNEMQCLLLSYLEWGLYILFFFYLTQAFIVVISFRSSAWILSLYRHKNTKAWWHECVCLWEYSQANVTRTDSSARFPCLVSERWPPAGFPHTLAHLFVYT